ncbi:hypothetical protein DSCO28_41100 [Desulfosarcina ovata subsp. sediminis]|uniref:Uncharacterized protein n=1 Tax=Desulfosarcina ovata subsp. sediminis TaxID=885957 RepID=A0A5K7ZTN4_9BACT|nr:hypothetical protein [Desulfosarcina ovata]BBO83544.1 hypothetical protein DSCO28_41100 [Desulfosarcina ovata subsp. sediminis]
MKQKYVVLLDNENGKLSIQEYAELDKEMLSLLCEEAYDAKMIKVAMQKDRNSLIQALRTHNMYPPGAYTERIADAIIEMFQPGANTSAELFFEERDLFESPDEEMDLEDKEEGDDDGEGDSTMDVDDLLDDDTEDDYEEKGIIKDLQKTIKVSDADTGSDEA